MAVTERRSFKDQIAMVMNDQNLGGIADVDMRVGYRNKVKAGAHGLQGPQAVVPLDQFLEMDVTTHDVTNVLDMATTPVPSSHQALWWGYEAGTGKASMSKHVVKAPVVHGITMNIPFNEIMNAVLASTCRFNDTDTLDDMHVRTTETIGFPTEILPARHCRCLGVKFGSDNLYHIVSAVVTATGRLLEDTGDGYAGVVMVELADWESLTVALTLRDVQPKNAGVDDYDMITEFLQSVMGALEIVLGGVGTQSGQSLYIKNLVWSDGGKRHNEGLTEHVLNGEAQFIDSDGITTRELYDSGTPADGMIYFAASS